MAAARFRTIGVPVLLLMLAAPVGVLAEAPAVDPDADKLLSRMTGYLGSLERFSLNTQNTLEDVLVSGQKIQYDFDTSVLIQRPDRLRAERKGDLIDQVAVYDGETITLLDLGRNFYAVSAAPGTIDELLPFARDTLDIVPPSGDLVYTNAYELLTGPVTSGFVVGKSVIGGVRCDHLAFSGPLVDWQVWIADGDKPLPYKYVITTKDDPAQPQYTIVMSDWNVKPKIDDKAFELTPPKGARQIDFLRMDTGHTSLD